jgi:hypothetical protein
MRPDDLKRLLTSVDMALTVAEAIANPVLQLIEDWDLTGWTCEIVPGAILFHQRDAEGRIIASVVAFRFRRGLKQHGDDDSPLLAPAIA